MSYTDEQKALIGGMIGTQFMGRRLSDKLRDGFTSAYAHLQEDRLDPADLRLIESALVLMTPQSCPTCSKEGYRDMIEALTATRRMISQMRDHG